jgi:hypothetical protein
MAQVVECLPSKHKALSFTPVLPKKMGEGWRLIPGKCKLKYYSFTNVIFNLKKNRQRDLFTYCSSGN